MGNPDGRVPAQGQIAQQIFWYTAFTSDMTKPGLPVVNEDGTPKWRMAASPYGVYWSDSMKLGYQDVGARTIPRVMSDRRQKAAWLYAQFTVSKSVSLQKTLVGLAPIRESDLNSPQRLSRARQNRNCRMRNRPERPSATKTYPPAGRKPDESIRSATWLTARGYPRLAVVTRESLLLQTRDCVATTDYFAGWDVAGAAYPATLPASA